MNFPFLVSHNGDVVAGFASVERAIGYIAAQTDRPYDQVWYALHDSSMFVEGDEWDVVEN
jgi:hypothetical protein